MTCLRKVLSSDPIRIDAKYTPSLDVIHILSSNDKQAVSGLPEERTQIEAAHCQSHRCLDALTISWKATLWEAGIRHYRRIRKGEHRTTLTLSIPFFSSFHSSHTYCEAQDKVFSCLDKELMRLHQNLTNPVKTASRSAKLEHSMLLNSSPTGRDPINLKQGVESSTTQSSYPPIHSISFRRNKASRFTWPLNT